MDIILLTTTIASLFLLVGAADPPARYLRLRYAVTN
ncbi:hypothetical protein SAMN06295998_13017 [Primorskyibacter flagellatus]|uniref:Uncharacterized protein n=1 Tax=Primorskyibacter flagellatus TaxID=1387277 RepID=A0A1W2EJ05_9RHOB|nr:hypothetical protein SAMN06295998_13017 [Primorskyibacter flagellatus]